MNNDNKKVKQLYDEKATSWQRKEPTIFTDFYGRPELLAASLPIKNMRCLDLGCGEGYFTRLLVESNASFALGVDISESMIAFAKEANNTPKVDFKVCDITENLIELNEKFDLVTASFTMHYLTIAGIAQLYKALFSIMNDKGRFCFIVPHPSFLAAHDSPVPAHFPKDNFDYYESRGQSFSGKIQRKDRTSNDVLAVHKTIEDYIMPAVENGFQVSKFKELSPSPMEKNTLRLSGFDIPTYVVLPYFLLIEVKKT